MRFWMFEDTELLKEIITCYRTFIVLENDVPETFSRKENHAGKKGKFQDFDTTQLRISPGFIEAYFRNKTSLLSENKDVIYFWCISI